jgi:hypothetical protein
MNDLVGIPQFQARSIEHNGWRGSTTYRAAGFLTAGRVSVLLKAAPDVYV